MKRILLLAFLFISLSAISQRKIALIVAIGQYPAGSGWGSLSSMNDIKYVKAGLMKHGFTDGDMTTLFNEQATKAGIIKALDDLYNRAHLNDIVVFHFSGHGQQIFDDNGDESDGYDEALIPYDAYARYDPVTYKGENHLRDDLLGAKLKRIREKIGPNGSLVILIDACHSGTMNRGVDQFVARGNPEPFKTPNYKPNIKKNLGEQDDFLGTGIGRFVLISASNPHQVNYETKDAENNGVGSLSYAFAKAIGELSKGSNYQTLFSKIKAFIQAQHPQQVPMIEGNAELEVFGGNIIPAQSYIGIERWVNDTTIAVNVGFLNSISKGAKFALYALNDKAETMPIVEGYISIAGTFQSYGVIGKKIPKGEVYKVKIEENGFGDMLASLSFKVSDEKGITQAALMSQKGSAPSLLIDQITKFVTPYEYLSISDKPDYFFDIITTKTGALNIQLVDRADSTRWNAVLKKGDTLSAAALGDMFTNLKKAMRVNYLRSMPDGGSMTQNIIVEITPLNPATSSDDLWMKEGEKFKIRIVNNNPYPVFFNLVDITPDNGVKVLFPYDGLTDQESVVQAQSEYVIDEVEVDKGTPVGREFMKFIFTKTAMDLRPVLARSGTRGAKSRSGFEDVIDDINKDGGAYQTRSSIPSKVKVDEVGVITRSFSIKK